MTLQLECPFHDQDEKLNTVYCKFTTESEAEYLEHTKCHKPNVMPEEDRLWQKRLQLAKVYADKTIEKRPWMFAQYVWTKKPKNQDCGVTSAMLQDWGVTDTDNYAGLDASTGGSGQFD